MSNQDGVFVLMTLDILILCFMSGNDAPVHELVDFIVAAQIAEKIEKETEDTVCEMVKNEVLIFKPI